ncbi:MAG TPA: GlxA family transcriptional regulator [Dongiaceae bacterium]|jgi:transcriptional regulator GlxA family with amidase domain|nr:GlxA family transcriptional regulator [Dongiaceae bacterium]
MLDVTIVLVNDGYASTSIGPMEVFYAAGRMWNVLDGHGAEPKFRISVASIDGAPVTSAYGLSISPQSSIDAIERADLILVSASSLDPATWRQQPAELAPWLRRWHNKGAMIGGLCTGVAFLAEAGLLDGRRATTHWGVARYFERLYPKVDWRPEVLITEDGGLFCSGGVYASVDLSLYLVEKLCGHQVAVECSKALLINMPRFYQAGYSILPVSRPHADQKIRQVEEYLQANFAKPLSIDELAQHAGMSRRNFLRRFKAATGAMPGAYLQMFRVAAARQMLEDSATSVQRVGSAVGYDNVTFFRQIFRRYTGVTPAEYRSNFKPVPSLTADNDVLEPELSIAV